MELVLSRETLLKPLQLAAGAIENKQAMAILAHVLLTVEDDELSLLGTDLEIELIGVAKLPAPIASPIQLTVPCRKLLDICKALPEKAEIEFEIDPTATEKIILRSSRSRYTLATLPAADFPKIDQHETIASFSMKQQDLRYLLQRTYFAMAQQDVRYFLNGLLLEFSENEIHAIASDGHRLAFNALPTTFSLTQPHRIMIPRKSVLELMRLLEQTEQEITIEMSASNIRVLGPEYQFTSKLIEGRIPDYRKAIPREYHKTVVLERDELKQALNRSAILSNEKVRAVYFEFRHNLLRILANNLVDESAEEEIEIQYSGDELGFGFNVTYLLDVLAILNSPQIHFTIAANGNSILIEEPHVEHSLFVVMPMRI